MNGIRGAIRRAAAGFATAAALAVAWDSAGAAEGSCVNVAIDDSTGEKQSLDPAFQTSFDDSVMLLSVYNRFVGVNESLDPVPELAESWEASADGRSWTYRIRQGVRFHDASTLDARDVAYTFQRLLDPAVGSPASGELQFLKDAKIEPLGDSEIRFTTAQPIAEFPRLMGTKFNLIVPEGYTHEQLRTHGVGTGPFVQEKFTPGGAERIFRRNPNYWNPGLPKADCIRITVIQEAVAALAALKSGTVDLLANVDPVVVATLRDDPAVQLLPTAAANSMSVILQIDVPPFDDLRVRKALKLAVDRQAMIDSVMLGFAEPGNDNPIPPSWPSAFTSQPLKRDVEAARRLLAEAGHGDGLAVDLYTSEAESGMTRFAQAFAEMAKEAGVAVNVIVTPPDSYWDEIWLKRPMFVSGWAPRTPLLALSHAYTRASKWNETHWYRDDFEALLNSASVEFDAAKRDADLKEAQRLLAEEGGVITPLFRHAVAALRTGCSGYKPHPQNFSISFETVECK